MAWLTLTGGVIVKVLSCADTLISLRVWDKEGGDVTEAAIRVGSIFDSDITSWTCG